LYHITVLTCFVLMVQMFVLGCGQAHAPLGGEQKVARTLLNRGDTLAARESALNCAIGYRLTKELNVHKKYYKVQYDRWAAECYRVYAGATENLDRDQRKRVLRSAISTSFAIEPDVALRFADAAHYTKKLASIERSEGKISEAFANYLRSYFYEVLSTSPKVLDASRKMKEALKKAVALATLRRNIEIARGVNTIANTSLGIASQEMARRGIETKGVNSARRITRKIGEVTIRQLDNVYLKYLQTADLSPLGTKSRRKISMLHRQAALETLKRLARKCLDISSSWKEIESTQVGREIITLARKVQSNGEVGPFAVAVAKLLKLEIGAADREKVAVERRKSLADKLELLKSLLDKKLITEDEYKKRKTKLLDQELSK